MWLLDNIKGTLLIVIARSLIFFNLHLVAMPKLQLFIVWHHMRCVGMSKGHWVLVQNWYRIFRTGTIFGTDSVLTFSGFGTGIYRLLPPNTDAYRYRTVQYRIFSVPV
ncbi:hypothetical protein HanIR_Chr02g0073871 [Helianthus annuus]|nr:hypothetical protein HanIR_Chr02g0073871 [Helianthus annuus]